MPVLEQKSKTPESYAIDDAIPEVTHRRQAAVVAIGRRAMAPEEVTDLLGDAAALAAETLDADASSVTELVAADGQLEMRLAEIDGPQSPDMICLPSDPSESLAGYALQVAQPMSIADLATEDRFTDQALISRGMRSAIVCPLTAGEHLLGVVGVYSNEPNRFASEDVLFVESVSHVVAATLARERAEAAQAQQAKFASAVLKTVDSLVVFLDEKGKIAGANRMFYEVSGFSIGDVCERTMTDALIAPGDVDSIEQALGKLRCGLELVEVESQLLTKSDGRRRVAWSFTAVRNESGEVASYIASAIDVTDQRHAEQELLRAQSTIESLKIDAETGEARPDSMSAEAPLAEDDAALQPFRRLPRGPNSDRREKPRRAYPYVQLLAPIYDGKMPEKSAFKKIRCRDIAAGGFSCAMRDEPDFNQVVVAFGTGAKLTYLTAEVVHVTRYEQQGNVRYILGCRYLGRARY